MQLEDRFVDWAMTRIARAAAGWDGSLQVAGYRQDGQHCTNYVLYKDGEQVSIASVADEHLRQADRPLALQKIAIEKMVKEYLDGKGNS